MEQILDEMLINAVKNHKFLYDTKHPLYKNVRHRQSAWKAISEAVKLNMPDCQKRWKSLRDKFVREKTRREQPSSSAYIWETSWPLFTSMEFLLPHVRTAKVRSKKWDSFSLPLDVQLDELDYAITMDTVNADNTHLYSEHDSNIDVDNPEVDNAESELHYQATHSQVSFEDSPSQLSFGDISNQMSFENSPSQVTLQIIPNQVSSLLSSTQQKTLLDSPLDDVQGTPDLLVLGKAKKCNYCGKVYSNISNVRKHVRRMHGAAFLPGQFTTNLIGSFKCLEEECQKQIFRFANHLRGHLTEKHGVAFLAEELEFDCEDDFLDWKEKLEEEKKAYYSVRGKEKINQYTSTKYYLCNRSGKYESKHKGKRSVKESSKIGSNCTSTMRREKDFKTGQVSVVFYGRHYGHLCSFRHVRLSRSARLNIAEKINSKVSFEEILREIREPVGDRPIKRLHFATKSDLRNIKQAYAVKDYKKHNSDATNGMTMMRHLMCEAFKELNQDNADAIENGEAEQSVDESTVQNTLKDEVLCELQCLKSEVEALNTSDTYVSHPLLTVKKMLYNAKNVISNYVRNEHCYHQIQK